MKEKEIFLLDSGMTNKENIVNSQG